jgi:DNA topoisomerase-1
VSDPVSSIQGNYKLVIAEKPDAARQIAEALGTSTKLKLQEVEIFDIPHGFDGSHYVVCSAAGHLYGLADPSQLRRVYPVFDTEWVAIGQPFSKRSAGLAQYIRGGYSKLLDRSTRRLTIISQLNSRADGIVHACDYDIEGETIGYNIIRYACNGPSLKNVRRAKFSTLTGAEVREAFSKMAQMDPSIAEAGTARHLVDYVWGINLSRALTEAHRRMQGKFRNITIGRVQGPTLAFVVGREIDARTHVPIPFWRIIATVHKGDIKFEAEYETKKLDVKSEVDEIYSRIRDEKTARVEKISETVSVEHPPFPFNIGELQKEAFRMYRLSPSIALSTAEKLYLRALISYPRTSSQKLPPSIGYQRIIEKLVHQKEYSKYSPLMQEGIRRNFPVPGNKEDPAHPAIYPTGINPSSKLTSTENKIYDLIARRFLACFAEDALLKRTSLELLIKEYKFVVNGLSLQKEGWRAIYSFRHGEEFVIMPGLKQGEIMDVVAIDLESRFTKPPPLYNQSSLLSKMESENIGTKATRAETISTLIDRGYIYQNSANLLSPTDMGLSIIESLERDCPAIISTDFSRSTEEDLDKIAEKRAASALVLAGAFHKSLSVLEQIHSSEKQIGSLLGEAGTRETISHEQKQDEKRALRKVVLVGKCPMCKTGYLKIIRSVKTHKRFLGCTNYSSGCRASAPLPRKGIIMKYPKECMACGWPMVTVKFSFRARGDWSICPNPACKLRLEKQGER